MVKLTIGVKPTDMFLFKLWSSIGVITFTAIILSLFKCIFCRKNKVDIKDESSNIKEVRNYSRQPTRFEIVNNLVKEESKSTINKSNLTKVEELKNNDDGSSFHNYKESDMHSSSINDQNSKLGFVKPVNWIPKKQVPKVKDYKFHSKSRFGVYDKLYRR